ncbi:Protein arginine N-methyltransferase SFM1 [Grifola frondosa]|uniref:Protein arginine N-methyltransferase SFM1 n=1 Tax=Grifola frondosa TaxID=5627 RepID=A0A1C7MHF0_GRIFR|nr:Protein arginine N-methyltransferase SFM1 [Grifola frondosa]
MQSEQEDAASFTYVIEHMEEDEDSSVRSRSGYDLSTCICAHWQVLGPMSILPTYRSLHVTPEHIVHQGFGFIAGSRFCARRFCGCIDEERTHHSRQKWRRTIFLVSFWGYTWRRSSQRPDFRASKHRIPTRHLGPVQMTTDTAVGVTKLVIQDKIPLSKIPYIDNPTISFNEKESVEMPFRYIADGKEPKIPPGMREHLYEDLNQSFDF